MTVENIKFEIATRVFAQMGLPTDSKEYRELEAEIQLLRDQLLRRPTK